MPEREFQRQIFAGVYLMMLGIVQASAFTYLLTDTLEYVRDAYLCSTCSSDLAHVASDMRLLRSIATLFAIALIAFEYTFFVMVMYKAVTARDILLLFLIGVIEFAMASQTSVGLNWWVVNVAFCFGGLLGLLHTATFNMREIFEGDAQREKLARSHNRFEIIVVVIAGAYATWVAGQLAGGALSGADERFYAVVWFAGFGVIMFWNGSIYIRQVTERRSD